MPPHPSRSSHPHALRRPDSILNYTSRHTIHHCRCSGDLPAVHSTQDRTKTNIGSRSRDPRRGSKLEELIPLRELSITGTDTCKISVVSSDAQSHIEMAIKSLPRDWENPSVFSRNKCRSHVPLRAHPTPESALLYFLKDPKAADTANLLSLNSSEWSFHLYDRPEDVPDAFSTPEFDDGLWGKVMTSACSFFGSICNFRSTNIK